MARPIEKRANIERGVVEIVAKKGLRAATIQDIAMASGVSSGLLYRYWKSRDELAIDIYRTHLTELVAQLAAAAAAESDAQAKLRLLVREFVRFADERPTLLRFLLLSQHDLAGSVPTERGVHALLSRVMSDGIAQKRLQAMDPDLATNIFMGMVLQPAVGCTYGTLKTPIGLHAEAILAAIERALFR